MEIGEAVACRLVQIDIDMDEADVALEQAVNDSGLSVEEYNNIVEIAQADPEVQEKLLQRLQGPPQQE